MDYPYTLAFYGMMCSLFTVQQQHGVLNLWILFLTNMENRSVGH